jgi:predicted dehydrogenase
LGFLGTGNHAWRSHAIPALQTGEFSLAALFDPSEKSIAKFRQKVGQHVPGYGREEDLINDPNIDAIVIASIDEAHPDQLARVVRARKPVFCEKPLAISREGLVIVNRALIEAETNKVLVTTCHPRNEAENAPYGWVRANLGNLQRKYGALEHVGLDFTYHATDNPWKKEERSLLLDHWGHEIGYMMKLLGWQPFTAIRVADGPDRYAVAGSLSERVTFFCSGSRKLATDHYPETITLRFEGGTETVFTLSGRTTFYDHETLEIGQGMASRLSYDDVFLGVMKRFAREIKAGKSAFTFPQLKLIAGSGVKLATGPAELHNFVV